MRHNNKIISVLLFLGIILSFLETPEASFSYQGYKTWTMKDSGFLVNVKKNTTHKTTSAQGMNIGTTYMYVAKIANKDKDPEAITIYRKTIDSGNPVQLTCYKSVNGKVDDRCLSAGHANDLLVVVPSKKNTNNLLSVTSDENKGLARYIIDGTKLYYTGNIKLLNNENKAIKVNGVRQFRHVNGYFYLLFKSGQDFYVGKIPDNETYFPEKTTKNVNSNGTVAINIYKFARLDQKNVVFANSNSINYYGNVETWVGQGFAYNPDEKTIYAPYFEPKNFDPSKNKAHIDTNAIIVYNVSEVLTNANVDNIINSKKNSNTIIFPSKTSFFLKASDKNLKDLEIESCGFRQKNDKNDHRFYIYANVASDDSKDGIYYINSYTSNNQGKPFDPVATKNSVVYTVQYKGVDDGVNATIKNGTYDSSGHYQMNATLHIYGLKSNLRINKFTREGYKFTGWHLHRKINDEWLYANKNNSDDKGWYKKGKQPSNFVLALYRDKQGVSQLSYINGDLVTCYAQWAKK